jgi:hypothetical protein
LKAIHLTAYGNSRHRGPHVGLHHAFVLPVLRSLYILYYALVGSKSKQRTLHERLMCHRSLHRRAFVRWRSSQSGKHSSLGRVDGVRRCWGMGHSQ